MAVVVADQAELAVVVFTAPPDGLTRRRPIGSSPLRGKCCAFVQSPYKPSGALNDGAPFGDFAAAEVVLVAGGFALGIGDDGGLVEGRVIDRGGAVAGGGVGSGERLGDALMVALRGDEAVHDPSGCREGGGGFAVQSGHGVIVSISDDLRACQATAFCFHDIGSPPCSPPLLAQW